MISKEEVEKEEIGRGPAPNVLEEQSYPTGDAQGQGGEDTTTTVPQSLVPSADSSDVLPDLQKARIYLVEENRAEKSYELLEKALKDGYDALCLTRVYPGILVRRYDIKNCNILWLSTAGKDESIRPRDLERLSLMLEQFLSSKKGVILIDGIEYLITNNDFLTVLRLIQSLRDQVAMNFAILIISLNPSTLGFQELSLLEREMDTVLRYTPEGI